MAFGKEALKGRSSRDVRADIGVDGGIAHQAGAVPEVEVDAATAGDALRELTRQTALAAEVVVTGRGPAPWLLEAADYVTHMVKEKHPYDRGISARRGVEY